MDVKTSFAALNYAQARPATAPEAGSAGAAAAPFDDVLSALEATLNRGETLATEAMTGAADPHALVEALANSELAVETAVTVRDKVVEAYQEILRMPV